MNEAAITTPTSRKKHQTILQQPQTQQQKQHEHYLSRSENKKKRYEKKRKKNTKKKVLDSVDKIWQPSHKTREIHRKTIILQQIPERTHKQKCTWLAQIQQNPRRTLVYYESDTSVRDMLNWKQKKSYECLVIVLKMKHTKKKTKTQYIYQVLCQLETNTNGWFYIKKKLHLNSTRQHLEATLFLLVKPKLEPLPINPFSESTTSFELNVITDSRNKSKRKHSSWNWETTKTHRISRALDFNKFQMSQLSKKKQTCNQAQTGCTFQAMPNIFHIHRHTHTHTEY